jgi:hypothetical protein
MTPLEYGRDPIDNAFAQLSFVGFGVTVTVTPALACPQHPEEECGLT